MSKDIPTHPYLGSSPIELSKLYFLININKFKLHISLSCCPHSTMYSPVGTKYFELSLFSTDLDVTLNVKYGLQFADESVARCHIHIQGEDLS